MLPPSLSLGMTLYSKQDMHRLNFSATVDDLLFDDSTQLPVSVVFTFQNIRLLMYVMSIKWKYLA